MTKTTSPKFQTLRSQRDELAAIYDSENGAGASKRLFKQKLGANESTLKNQINLLCEFVSTTKLIPPKMSSGAVPGQKPIEKKPSAATMTRAQFNALPPKRQSEFCLAGGKLVN